MNLEPLFKTLGLAPASLNANGASEAQLQYSAKLLAVGNLMAERRCTADEVRVGMLAAHVALTQGASAYRALELGLRMAMMLRVVLPDALAHKSVEEVARVH